MSALGSADSVSSRASPSTHRIGWRWPDRMLDIGAAAVVGSTLAVFLGAAVGTFPTGNDPANWLAAAHGLIALPPAEATLARPLVPGLVALLAPPLGELEALRVVGVASAIAVALAVFAVVRSGAVLPFAIGAALFAGLSRPVVETVAFGGYPQNFALAACVATAFFAARHAEGPSRRRGAWLAAALVNTALAHHVYFVLAVLAVACVIAQRILAVREWKTFPGHARAFTLPLGLGFLAVAPAAVVYPRRGYEPGAVFDPMSREAALGYMFGDGSPFYLAVVFAGASFALLSVLSRRYLPAAMTAGTALMAVSLSAFAVSGEPRLLAMLLVGAAISCALALEAACSGLPRSRVALTLVMALGMVAFVPGARSSATDVFAYYRVMDRDMAATIAFVDGEASEGRVAVASGRNGWPIGWWFEGMGGRHVLAGSEARWLAFQGERRDADIVARLTTASTSAVAARDAHDSGVSLLVADRGRWDGWKRWLSEADAAVEVAFENDGYIVLRFADAEAAR